jgi:hypothetical protein
MKIIASRTDRAYGSEPDTFIVEISLLEIQKVANKAGYQSWRDEDTKKLLAPGKEYDIAAGYDFRSEIVQATKAMASGFEMFTKAAGTMHRFVNLIQQQEPTE